METLQNLLNSLYATKVENFKLDMLNRKITMRCISSDDSEQYIVLMYGVSLFTAVDEDEVKYDASRNLENLEWFECVSILVIGDKTECIARGDFSSQFPKTSVSANLLIETWSSVYLFIKARGIIINGEEFLL